MASRLQYRARCLLLLALAARCTLGMTLLEESISSTKLEEEDAAELVGVWIAEEGTARFFSQDLLNAALAKQHVELGRVNTTEAFATATNLTAVSSYLSPLLLPHAENTTLVHMVRGLVIAGVELETGLTSGWFFFTDDSSSAPTPVAGHDLIGWARKGAAGDILIQGNDNHPELAWKAELAGDTLHMRVHSMADDDGLAELTYVTEADYYKTPNATVDDVADAVLKLRLNTNNLGRR